MAKEFKLLDDERDDKDKEAKVAEAEGKVRVDMKEGEDEPPRRGRNRTEQGRDSRWSEHTERTRKAESERDEHRAAREKADEENRLLREQMQENNRLQREALEMHRASLQGPPRDELEDEHTRLKETRASLQKEYQSAYTNAKGQLSQDVIDSFQKRYSDLEDSLRENSSARAARQYAPRQDPRMQAARQVEDQIKLKYPDVFAAGPRAQAHSQLVYNSLVAAGEPVGWATLDKAMDQTRAVKSFGIKAQGRPAPSDNIRRRFASPPRGGAVGNEETDDSDVELSPEEAAMARSFSAHLKGADDKEVYRRFVRTSRR